MTQKENMTFVYYCEKNLTIKFSGDIIKTIIIPVMRWKCEIF